jgi:hypothetical protein
MTFSVDNLLVSGSSNLHSSDLNCEDFSTQQLTKLLTVVDNLLVSGSSNLHSSEQAKKSCIFTIYVVKVPCYGRI